MRPGIVMASFLPAAVLVLGCNPIQPSMVTVKMTWTCGFPEPAWLPKHTLDKPFADFSGKYTGYRVVTIDGHIPGGGYGGDNGRIGNDPNPSLEELLR